MTQRSERPAGRVRASANAPELFDMFTAPSTWMLKSLMSAGESNSCGDLHLRFRSPRSRGLSIVS
jgi:hypothetical protein